MKSCPSSAAFGFSFVKSVSYSRTSASTACAAETQWIVDFTFRPSGRVAAAGRRIVCAAQLDNVARFVLHDTCTLDEISVAQDAPRVRARDGNTASADLHGSLPARCRGPSKTEPCAIPAVASSGLLTASISSTRSSGIVVDHHPQRTQHRHDAIGALVQVLANEVFQQRSCVMPFVFETPISAQKFRIASGV